MAAWSWKAWAPQTRFRLVGSFLLDLPSPELPRWNKVGPDAVMSFHQDSIEGKGTSDTRGVDWQAHEHTLTLLPPLPHLNTQRPSPWRPLDSQNWGEVQVTEWSHEGCEAWWLGSSGRQVNKCLNPGHKAKKPPPNTPQLSEWSSHSRIVLQLWLMSPARGSRLSQGHEFTGKNNEIVEKHKH